MLASLFKGGLKRFGYEVRNFKTTPNANPLFALRRLLRDQPAVIFDVGANQGDVTATYRSLFPAATIYAFEPFPPTCGKLKARFQSSAQVKVLPLAVGADRGKKPLMIYKADVLNSFLEIEETSWLKTIDVKTEHERSKANANESEKIEVDCTTLDVFCEEQSIWHIDLLKLDVQGTELRVITGASRLLSSEAVDVLFCEANFAPQYKGQAYFRDIDKAMSDHRYRLFGLYELTSGGDGSLGFGNAIFVSDAFHKKISASGRYWQRL